MATKSIEAKGVRDYPKFEVSPFFTGLRQVKTRNKIVAIGARQYGLFDTKTGEVSTDQTAFLGVRKIVDKGEFIKVYTGAVQALFDLSPKAQKVYGYFMQAQQMNNHQVYFSPDKCQEITNYKSPRSIYEGVAELLEKGFIARAKDTNFFYINPEVSFNGNRLVQFQDWIVKGSEVHREIIRQEQEQKEKELAERQIQLFEEEKPLEATE